MKKDKITKLAARLSTGLGRDSASLDLFSLFLEQEFDERFVLNEDLFDHMPERLRLEQMLELKVLNELLEHFQKKEDYEFCALIKDLYAKLLLQVKLIN
jgi:hypothetical protein